jgi:transcriptional regulator with XRE-family HTH domain
MTQVDLAERLEKPQSFVAKVESGERRLDVVELIYICNSIQMDPTEIIGELSATLFPAKPSPGRKKGKA